MRSICFCLLAWVASGGRAVGRYGRWVWVAVVMWLTKALPAVGASSPSVRADSLQRLLAASRADTNRVELLIQLAWDRTDDNPLAAIRYGQRGLRLARQLGHLRGECRSLLILGWAFMRAGDYPTAVYTQLQARRLAERIHFAGGIIHADNGIGYAYAEQGNYQTALRYYLQAKKLARQKRDDVLLTPILGNIGQAYLYAGQLDSAWHYTQLGYRYDQRYHDWHSEIGDLSLLGDVAAARAQPAEARRYYQLSIQRARGMPVSYALCRSYLGLARLANADNDTEQALRYARQALQASQQGRYAKGEFEASDYLAKIYAARGHSAEAYHYLATAVATRDSLFSQGKVAQLQALAFGEQMRQQEQAEQRFKYAAVRRQNWLAAALAITALLGVLLYLLLKQQQLRREVDFRRERAELERQRALAVLEAEENERRRIGSDLHDGIGQLLSAAKLNLHALQQQMRRELHGNLNGHQLLFDNALSVLDESFWEVRSISHNLMPNALIKRDLPEAIRHFITRLPAGHGLRVEVEAKGFDARRLPATTENVLLRVVQELLQNILKHAQATHVTVRLEQVARELVVLIKDNGVGFDPLALGPEAGIGLRNVQTRMAYLGGRVVFDAAPGDGTTVRLQLPLPVLN